MDITKEQNVVNARKYNNYDIVSSFTSHNVHPHELRNLRAGRAEESARARNT